MSMDICQSCGMPMQADDYGRNGDDSINRTYCKYCFTNGAFINNVTMEEKIDACAPILVREGDFGTEAEARAHLEKLFPTLERWKK